MKTLTHSYLKMKMWYRFLKVMYLLCLFISIILINGIWINEFGDMTEIDCGITTVLCKYENKEINLKKVGIELRKYEYDDWKLPRNISNSYSNRDSIKKILLACYDENRTFEYTNNQTKEKMSLSIQEIIGMNINTHKLIDIKPRYSYTMNIVSFVTMNIAVLLFFELVKRIFYYVVLGTIKPKN